MNTLDLIIIGLIVFFALWGYMRGLLLMIGGVVVVLVSGFLASRLGELVANAITSSWNGLEMVSRVALVHQVLFWVSFTILCVLGNFALKLLNFITELPIIGGLKHFGGLLLGLLMGVVIAGFFVVMLDTYPIYEGWASLADGSKIVRPLLQAISYTFALWPQSLRDVAQLLRVKAGT